MKTKLLLPIAALVIFAGFVFAGQPQIDNKANGLSIGSRANDLIGFHGAAPVAQRSGTAQAALSTNKVLGANASINGTNIFMVDTNQLQAVLNLLIEVRAAIVEKGLIKGE